MVHTTYMYVHTDTVCTGSFQEVIKLLRTIYIFIKKKVYTFYTSHKVSLVHMCVVHTGTCFTCVLHIHIYRGIHIMYILCIMYIIYL